MDMCDNRELLIAVADRKRLRTTINGNGVTTDARAVRLLANIAITIDNTCRDGDRIISTIEIRRRNVPLSAVLIKKKQTKQNINNLYA